MTQEKRVAFIYDAWEKLRKDNVVTKEINNLINYEHSYDRCADKMLQILVSRFSHNDYVKKLFNKLELKKDLMFHDTYKYIGFHGVDSESELEIQTIDKYAYVMFRPIRGTSPANMFNEFTTELLKTKLSNFDPHNVNWYYVERKEQYSGHISLQWYRWDVQWNGEQYFTKWDEHASPRMIKCTPIEEMEINRKPNNEENIVKRTCQELGLTQKELANLVGVTTSAISQWNSEVPRMAEVALTLLIENHHLKKDIESILNGQKTIQRLLTNKN